AGGVVIIPPVGRVRATGQPAAAGLGRAPPTGPDPPAGRYVMLKLHVCAATWYRWPAAGWRKTPPPCGGRRPTPPAARSLTRPARARVPGPAAAAAAARRRDRRAVPDLADRGDAPPGRAVAGGPGAQPQARAGTVALPERGPAATTAPAVGRAGGGRVRVRAA